MKRITIVLFLSAFLNRFHTRADTLIGGSERVQIVRQDISEFDKNGDGKLTGPERDNFIKAKRKEADDAENARRAANLKAKPPKQVRPRPPLSPEAAQNPVPVGVPKNIEDTQK